MNTRPPIHRAEEPVASEPARVLLFDVDGVLWTSQPGKNASWTLAVLYLRGEVDKALIDRLRDSANAKSAAIEAFDLLRQHHKSAMVAVASFDGLSREETRQRVWRLFMAGYHGQATEEDLERLRNSIKDHLILYASEVIQGTLEFIRAAHGKLPLGAVTQAKLLDVKAQAEALNFPIELFDVFECAGDPFYRSIAIDKKAAAYVIAARRLGATPLNSIAFEDSDGGLDSASRGAGLHCIALRQIQNRQSLKLARLVLPDLGLLAKPEIIGILADQSVKDVLHRLRESVGAITVGNILGGRRLSTSEIHAGGDAAGTIECTWPNVLEDDPMEGLPRLIAKHVKQVAGSRFVGVVGVSIKGPLRYVEGNAVIGPWKELTSDAPWLFEEKLREALSGEGVAFGQTDVILDSVAALRGEMHVRGTIAGQTSGVAIILGTGIGCAIREKGKILEEIGQYEPGDGRFRLLSSLGRHVVFVPFGFHYCPIPQGCPEALLEAGQNWMSERLGGAWLPRRVAWKILRADPGVQEAVLRDMEATEIDLNGYTCSRERDANVEEVLLSGLTRASLKGNEWAREVLSEIGYELGLAFAAFVWAFQDYEAMSNIVLVSTIAELLGKNVTGTGIQEDVLMDSLRKSIAAALIERGMDDAKALAIAKGVRRSNIGRERELLAFDPV